MIRIKNSLAVLLALALLLLSGCRQTDIRQSRALAAGTDDGIQTLGDLVDAENRAVQSGQSAAEESEEESSGDSYVWETPVPESESTLSHGELLERQQGDVIEIGEDLFVTQTNDIYLNAQDYLGKTLVYEGIYKSSVIVGEDGEAELIHYVIRYGPGCCGYDDNAGFEVMYDGPWPSEDEWVEVSGALAEYELDGWKFLCVEIDSLTVKQERGAEYVLR